MPPALADRIALVTGASRGIGYATALALAKAGAHVVAVARTVGGLEELDDAIRALGGSATLVPLDLKDYDGIDTPERDKLLAATHDLEGMRQFIGADTLAFLSVEGIYRAMGHGARDPLRPQFTDHCFTGDYPTPLTDQTGQDHAPRQLSLLAEAS